MIFRKEINQLALRSIIDGIQQFLSITYISSTLLLIYGIMWKFNIHFDTRVFAIIYPLLNHIRMYIMVWFTEAISHAAKYIAAVKRIQVCLYRSKTYILSLQRVFFYRNFSY